MGNMLVILQVCTLQNINSCALLWLHEGPVKCYISRTYLRVLGLHKICVSFYVAENSCTLGRCRNDIYKIFGQNVYNAQNIQIIVLKLYFPSVYLI
jgi:hypothetical protein